MKRDGRRFLARTIFAMDLGHGDTWRFETCTACPAQTLSAGEFDVTDRPGPATRYDPTAGYRVNPTTGLPECVHPSRVRLPAGRYASNGEPLQAPDEVADVAACFIRGVLRVTSGAARTSAFGAGVEKHRAKTRHDVNDALAVSPGADQSAVA